MQKNIIFLVLICAAVLMFSGAVSAADVPSANFTADKYWGVNNVTVHFTDTSTGNPTSWNWDLGDGTTSTEQNPTHTYSTLGSYNVSLTATNSAGSSTKTISKCINVLNDSNVFTSKNGVSFFVANDAGVKYDMPNGVTKDNGGVYPYIPQTYYIAKGNGGTNPIQLSTDPNIKPFPGQTNTYSFTNTTDMTGTFYVTFNGGIGHLDDAILMLAVNGTIANDFSVTITSSGYTYTLFPVSTTNPKGLPSNITYVTNVLNETFYKSDFIYQQNWRPYNTQDYYPIYNGEDVNDPNNQFHLMFIDLNVGAFTTTDQIPNEIDSGSIKVTYTFHNLENFAAFAAYGWLSACAWGTGIPQASYNSACGYNVIGTPRPVSDFTANATSGNNSLTVQFTDKSANSPTSWSWDFGDGSTSNLQNPTHTYAKAGNYTVKLTASNANVGNTETKTGYITVLDTVAPVLNVTPKGGSYNGPQSVVLAASELSEIYYTLDGTTPTRKSMKYSGPISVKTSKKLNYTAWDAAGNQSLIYTQQYRIYKSVRYSYVVKDYYKKGWYKHYYYRYYKHWYKHWYKSHGKWKFKWKSYWKHKLTYKWKYGWVYRYVTKHATKNVLT